MQEDGRAAGVGRELLFHDPKKSLHAGDDADVHRTRTVIGSHGVLYDPLNLWSRVASWARLSSGHRATHSSR